MVTEFQQQEPTWVSILKLLRWHKPEGRLILMIPALWAVFLAAEGTPPLPIVAIIILGSLVTSAAGCVINDLWDRNIDPQVERTRLRPLASRALSVKTGVVIFFIALSTAAVLTLYLNPLSFWLSFAAVPVIVCYPLAKRFFPVPQLVLSIAWGFAVLISWSAVTPNLVASTWILWGATVLWTLGFDTVYAMSDREDDLQIGVNSSALFFGDRSADAVGVFFAATAILFAWLSLVKNLHPMFWLSWSVAVIGWIWQYNRLRQQNIPKQIYGEIFRQNVWLGFVLLFGIIIGCLLST